MTNHHQLIRDLVAEVRNLRAHFEMLRDAEGYEADARARWTDHERELERQAQERRYERELERQAQERRYAYDDAVAALERAHRQSNNAAEVRALRRLREL